MGREASSHQLRDFNPSDDLHRSIEYAYEVIRARVAGGGRGWGGYGQSEAKAVDNRGGIVLACVAEKQTAPVMVPEPST
jgi:hypothetical protein